MGVSPLGEAYINFGKHGGIVAMLLLGLLWNRVMAFLVDKVRRDEAFFFWIPFIFYQAIKAETDLLAILNQAVKGGAMALCLYWLVVRLAPLRQRGGAASHPSTASGAGVRWLRDRRIGASR